MEAILNKIAELLMEYLPKVLQWIPGLGAAIQSGIDALTDFLGDLPQWILDIIKSVLGV